MKWCAVDPGSLMALAQRFAPRSGKSWRIASEIRLGKPGESR
jgi:hypothetical protein